MKKLLSILTSVSVASVAATSVVACSVPNTHVDVNFTGGNNLKVNADGTKYTWNNVDYSKSELDAALNGNAAILNSYFPVAMSFDDLNSQLLSLVSFNQSLTVKTQKNQKQLRDFRNTYLGRDTDEVTEENYLNNPTVDGIKYKDMDDAKTYYNGFNKTSINSLVGLQDLYEAGKDKDLKSLGWGEAAQASYAVAEQIFGPEYSNAKDVETLMKNFANSKKNPAFTNITYNTDLQEFKSKSKIINGFDKNSKNDNLVFTSDASNDYAENNTNINDKDDLKTDKVISERTKADPYGALILPTVDSVDKIETKTLKSFETNEKDNKTLKELFTTSSDEVNYAQIANKDGKTYSFSQNLGQYLVKKAAPLSVTYHFETDMEHSAKNWTEKKKDSEGFNIKFTIDNLAEVFSPYITGVDGTTITNIKKQDDGKYKIVFNNTKLDKDSVGKLSIQGVTIDGDVQHDKDSKGNATNSYVIATKNADEITYTDGKANFKYKISDNAEFETTQLSWIFRGYKFLSEDSIKADGSDVTDEALVNADKDSKAPERNAKLKAEITHHLRDMKTTGVEVKSSDTPDGPYYQNN